MKHFPLPDPASQAPYRALAAKFSKTEMKVQALHKVPWVPTIQEGCLDSELCDLNLHGDRVIKDCIPHHCIASSLKPYLPYLQDPLY